jgi:hypothetical protein
VRARRTLALLAAVAFGGASSLAAAFENAPIELATASTFAGPGTVGPAADVEGHVPAGELAVHEGNLTTTADGQHVEGVHITGRLVVNHRGVTATNFRARGVSVASGTNRSASVDLSWCSVGDRAGALDAYDGVGVGNYRIRRCEVYGTVDLVKLSHGYAEVTESWLHDPVQWTSDPQQGGKPSHVDMFQTSLVANASGVVIRDNRFDAWAFRRPQRAGDTAGNLTTAYSATGHVSLFRHTTNWTIGAVTVTGNRFDGDAYRCIYAIHDAGDPPTKATITDNVLVRRYPAACSQQTLSATTPSAIVWGRNVDETGATVSAPGTTAAPPPPTTTTIPEPTTTTTIPPPAAPTLAERVDAILADARARVAAEIEAG